MNSFIKKYHFEILLFGLLSISGFLVFRNFLRYSLCCDDWFLLYTVKSAVSTSLLIKAFTGPYGGQQFFMFIVNHFFGYNPFYYFFLSIFFRVLASFSIYFLAKTVSKNKFLSIIASVLFIFGNAGIETTEGVVNSINYFSLFFVNLGINYFIKNIESIKTNKGYTSFLSAIGLISLGVLIAPARASAIVLVYLASEIFLTVFKISKFSQSVRRISLFSLILLFIITLGFFRPEGSSAISPVSSIFYLIRNPNTLLNVISYSLTNFAEIIFPETIFVFPSFIKIILSILVIATAILLIVKALKSKKRNEAFIIATFLVWPLIFIFIPYIYYPAEFYVTESRYIMFATSGLYLLIISLVHYFFESSRQKKYLIASVFLLMLLTFANIKVDQIYIDTRLSYRDNKIVDAIYNVINPEIKNSMAYKRPIIYLESNGTEFTYFAITYGGAERYGITNGYKDNTYYPIFITSFDEINKITKDTKTSLKYGLSNVGLDQIYAFKIKNRIATSETNEIRLEIKNNKK